MASTSDNNGFWPHGARLAVSASLMFEAGGQDFHQTMSPLTEPVEGNQPDLPTNSWFDYGIREGIPRLLNLFDRHGVKATSFMVGQAVARHPEIARMIVARGHEAAAHGRTWSKSYQLPRDEERAFIEDSVAAIMEATGERPIGWNANALRNSENTLDLLRDLGFLYHIDDVSRDEPFIVPLRDGEIVTVPYTLHVNDLLVAFPGTLDPLGYEQLLKDEFDQLWEEGGSRRRMMCLSTHDRIGGRPAVVRILDRVLTYMRARGQVWFARKDEIARWALETREITLSVHRGPVRETGLPGPAEC